MTENKGNVIQGVEQNKYVMLCIRIDKSIIESAIEIKNDLGMTKVSETYRHILRLGIQQHWSEKRYGKAMRRKQTIK